jgi:hypothetical protein
MAHDATPLHTAAPSVCQTTRLVKLYCGRLERWHMFLGHHQQLARLCAALLFVRCCLSVPGEVAIGRDEIDIDLVNLTYADGNGAWSATLSTWY